MSPPLFLQFFPEVAAAPTVREGLRDLLLVGGLGKMRPNTVLFGWKHMWHTHREACASSGEAAPLQPV